MVASTSASLRSASFFQRGADGGVVAKAAEEEFDFGEGEAHVAGESDEEYAVESVAWVAALAAGTMGRGEEAAFFVEADGGGVEVGAVGEITDFHVEVFLSHALRRWATTNRLRHFATVKAAARLPHTTGPA